MFKPYFGQCDLCPPDKIVLIVINKPHLCSYHNRLRKEKSKVKSIKPKKQFKPSGELRLFKEIWEERLHISKITPHKELPYFDIRCFSHVLAKGNYPRFKLLKENIWLETPEEHHEWEFGDRSDPKWDEKKEFYQQLKQQYYEKK